MLPHRQLVGYSARSNLFRVVGTRVTIQKGGSVLCKASVVVCFCTLALSCSNRDSPTETDASQIPPDEQAVGISSDASVLQDLCGGSETDPLNCGVCGCVCNPGLICSSGRCLATGGPQSLICLFLADGGLCGPQETIVYPLSDPLNCGACSDACATGVTCTWGVCTTSCSDCTAASLSCCPTDGGGPVCTDFTQDPANCGGCGKACSSGDCVNGVCM